MSTVVPEMPSAVKEQLILVAGFGSIGRRHFQNLRRLGLTRFAFYRSNLSALDAAEIAEYPAFRDLDQALELQPAITIVATPTALHLPVALRAALAGSHLFIEKPIAHSLAGCDELAALVTRHDLITMIGCQHRFHPLLISLRRQLHGGRIGQVFAARAEYGEFLPGWHPWEDHRRSYSAREELGGGVILTLIHPLDYLYWLFGPVASVHASIGRAPFLQTETKDDLAEITLEFLCGVVGQVHLDYVQRPPVHTLVVVAEKGRVHLDFLNARLDWVSADGTVETEGAPRDFERNMLFIDEMRHFLDSVEQQRAASIPLRDGISVLEIALRAKADALARHA